MQAQPSLRLAVIGAGDLAVFSLVTLIGFATHGELTSAGPRFLTTLIPLTAAWALIAPWLGAFNLKACHTPRDLWRPVLAMALAAPMAGWLRGLMLGSPVIPVFVLVLGGTSAFGLLIWRSLYLAGTWQWEQSRLRGKMDELALVKGALDGDLDSFNRLVLAYQDMAFNLAYRMLGDDNSAEDVTQKAFISAYRGLTGYRGGSFKSWVLKMVTNACYDELRHRKRHPTTPLEPEVEEDEEIESPALDSR